MKKKVTLIIILVVLIICFCKYYSPILNFFYPPKKDTTSIEKTLSQKEFTTLADKLSVIVEKQNPRVALAVLDQDAKESNQVANSCHLLAHEVGHAAFSKYKNFGEAMSYQNEVCNSGYMHGVIESYFSTTKDITAKMLTVCNGYHPKSFISWECYHGMGHGFMYFTNNNVPLSLTDCGFTQDYMDQLACANGVFMENFNTDQVLHPSKFLNPSNPFYPCNKEADKYKSNCYLYAPVYYLELHPGAYKDALEWCLTAEAGYQSICTEGVGSETMKENINNPKLVEQFCGEGKGDQRNDCISGMVGLYINNFGSLTPARSLCNQLNSENKSVCEGVIQGESFLFE